MTASRCNPVVKTPCPLRPSFSFYALFHCPILFSTVYCDEKKKKNRASSTWVQRPKYGAEYLIHSAGGESARLIVGNLNSKQDFDAKKAEMKRTSQTHPRQKQTRLLSKTHSQMLFDLDFRSYFEKKTNKQTKFIAKSIS